MPSTSKNLYLAYNKSIETEARAEFPKNTTCKTTSAFAFAEIVAKGTSMPGIKAGKRILNPSYCWRDVLGLNYRQYDEKLIVIETMSRFFASASMSISDFFKEHPDPLYTSLIQSIVKKNIKAMADKTLACSFGFYLKYYHILLARGIITFPQPYDLVMIDEFQDSQPVVLEIFKLIPAHTKMAVGDSDQSINGSFLYTTDAFSAIEEYGVTKHLTRSFRCSTAIAEKVEKYGRKNFDPKYEFKGIDYPTESDTSIAFISKTNSSLIGKMVLCDQQGKTYKNKRDPKLIFKLVNTLIHLKPGCQIHDSSLKFLLDDVNAYYSSSQLQFQYSSLMGFILAEHPEDRLLKGTIGLISKYGGKVLRETYNQALAYYKDKRLHADVWLTTAHSSKGHTFGTVEVGSDLNIAVLEALAIPRELRTADHRETLMIGYVVVTRARYNLINCQYL